MKEKHTGNTATEEQPTKAITTRVSFSAFELMKANKKKTGATPTAQAAIIIEEWHQRQIKRSA